MHEDDLLHEGGVGTGSPIDLERFKSRFDQNEEMQIKVAELFLGDVPDSFLKLKEAADAGDFAAVKKAAHMIANSCGVIQASEAVALSRKIEGTIAAGGSPAALIPVLGEEIGRIVACLKELFAL